MSDLLGQISERLQRAIASEIEVQIQRTMPGRHAARYAEGLAVERDGEDVIVRVTGTLPNMLEHGLGPGGIGTSGPVDLRTLQLKGEAYRRVPVAPGVVRTMSRAGRPWVHPGFAARHILRVVQGDLRHIARRAYDR